MDRHRDRDGGRPYSRTSGRTSSDRYSAHHHYNNSRSGFSDGRGGFADGNNNRSFSNSHHHSYDESFGSGPAFRSMAGGGGGAYSGFPGPISGQKRPSGGGFTSGGRGRSPDINTSFAKLFIGSVPRTATEEQIRPLFEAHGNVIEVALIKDKRTGQQQGCCFIKYSVMEEAEQAIRALHNQVTLPGGSGPIQVRYADGEKERLGKLQSANEFKLFVGSLNRQATEKEIEEIFSPYGRVEDVYIMRDEFKQCRGCAFVKYSHRDMAAAAINALNGIFVMRGCDQPLTVRFADPKRPKMGESRSSPAFGSPGLGTRPEPPPGARPMPNMADPQIPANSWQPMSPQSKGPSPHVSVAAFGSQLASRGGIGPMTSMANPAGSICGSVHAPHPGVVGTPPASQQVPPLGQQISPLQKSLHSPQHLSSSLQVPQQVSSFSHSQAPQAPAQPSQMPLLQNVAQPAIVGQGLTFGLSAQLPVSQPQASHSGPQQASLNLVNQQQQLHLQPNLISVSTQPQLLQPVQLSNQMRLQQAQLLQQNFQSAQLQSQQQQQAFSQLQQQIQLMQQQQQQQQHQQQQPTQNLNQQQQQQPTQNINQQQNVQASKQQALANTVTSVTGITSSTMSTPVAGPPISLVPPATCNWTEHISPEGYKYYYNSSTGESKWEKPEEFILFEQQQLQQKMLLLQQQQQQQQKALVSQLQTLPQVQVPPQVVQPSQQISQTQQISQVQQLQLHAQVRQQQQPPVQQLPLTSVYQASGMVGHQNVQDLGYSQLQQNSSSIVDPARLQGLQAAQEWMWKNKPAGT